MKHCIMACWQWLVALHLAQMERLYAIAQRSRVVGLLPLHTIDLCPTGQIQLACAQPVNQLLNRNTAPDCLAINPDVNINELSESHTQQYTVGVATQSNEVDMTGG
jgi:hypothetical protein